MRTECLGPLKLETADFCNYKIISLQNAAFGNYDYIVVSFSGGKDSFACILRILEMGAPREKIDLIRWVDQHLGT